MTPTESQRRCAAIRERVWKIIRGLIEFTCDEAALLAEVPRKSVATYVFMLYCAGYVRQAGKRKEADGRKHLLWRITKNTGPKAPYPCRCLYDPNLDDIKEVKEKEDLQTPGSTKTKKAQHVD